MRRGIARARLLSGMAVRGPIEPSRTSIQPKASSWMRTVAEPLAPPPGKASLSAVISGGLAGKDGSGVVSAGSLGGRRG